MFLTHGRKSALVLIIILLLTAIGGTYWWFFGASPVVEKQRPMGIAVEAEEVRRGSITRRIPATGTLKANQSVTLRPETQGTISKFMFQEGQYVEKDTPLIKLDDRLIRTELTEAEARVVLAKAKYDRARKLVERGAGPLKNRDEALGELRVAEARVQKAKVQLEQTLIQAPFEGVIGLKDVSIGAFVDPHTELLTIVDQDPIKIDFKIPAAYVKSISKGQKVGVQVDGFKDELFEADIDAVDARVDPLTHSIQVRAVLPNENGALKPGLFARVKLTVGAKDNAILVPDVAIVQNGDEKHVFKVFETLHKGKKLLLALKAIVTTGLSEKGYTEVINGLSEGDQVITIGSGRLQHGLPIRIVYDIEAEDDENSEDDSTGDES